ncbi:hypothetical protein GDO81_029924 [Engystomops pustulosus]|uniref:Uncharacterized protein n=1 Tax=Engystomops pustulosus TaxID=76066 RepID=A0AAV6ZBE2_ENGPU|nr:hypothetical protein GDO81_029924 [Engystomops pustulosus]
MTRAGDLCLSSAGARVSLATSSDDRHPAECIIDGNPETFWTTTGMFPQEFIISLNGLQKIGKIIIESSSVRSLKIYTSATKEPTDFEPCTDRGKSRHVVTIPLLLTGRLMAGSRGSTQDISINGGIRGAAL